MRYSVKEEPRYLEEIEKTEPEKWLSDEHRKTVIWLLERNPFVGRVISETAGLYLIYITREQQRHDPIAIYYLIDGETVTVLSALIDESEED